MRPAVQTSESLKLGILLAISGGFMDAYSYIGRGEVFANAQTGNILLCAVHLFQGEFPVVVDYLFPVLAFVVGIALADIVRLKDFTHFHWRQSAILVEALILAVVAFMPQSMNLAANSMTSLACGIQVESFRKIHGQTIATTMCIGNLRSATESLCHYFFKKEKHFLSNGLLYYGVILIFALGAVIGNAFVKIFHERAILFCCLLHLMAFALMFIDREQKERA